jgi:hypothetical protein
VTELDVLRIVSERLSAQGLDYMLTGSFAMAWYATPRMTRDLDIVVALKETDVDALVDALLPDFYVDRDAASLAVRTERLFNLMHLASGIKVDLIIRKASEYRQVEFARRVLVRSGDLQAWVVTREDLILSKLEWARETGSELQKRDVLALLAGPVDMSYLGYWAERIGVARELEETLRCMTPPPTSPNSSGSSTPG